MLPLLKIISDTKEHTYNEIKEGIAREFKLTDEDKNKRSPSNTLVYTSRIRWAMKYLKEAKLLELTGKKHVKITQRGIKLLKENPKMIDHKILLRYEEFRKFRYGK
jgi:restriction system protein